MTERIHRPTARPPARRLVIAAFVTALCPLACGQTMPGTTTPPDLSPSQRGGGSLSGTEWVLTELRGGAPLGGVEITLVVDDSSAGGNSGCNHYGGTPVVTADTFRLDEIVATARACEDARLMDQESDFLALLALTSAYEVEGRALVLMVANEETLVFRAAGD